MKKKIAVIKRPTPVSQRKASAASRKSYGQPAETPAGDQPLPLPKLRYAPRRPRRYRPVIGMIGCGGITSQHLRAYTQAGYKVAAFCDIDEEKARQRREEFYPKADLYTDHRRLLERTDLDVIDIATHPAVRAPQIEDALNAGKHVLSQKPFVLDLDLGERLVALAERRKVRLAVNQNGRWAPYVSYARELVKAGRLGELASVDMTLAWDHTWIRGTAFEKIRHVILYDFAIHWYDMAACLFGNRPALSVFANLTTVPGQTIAPPLSGHSVVAFQNGLATLAFHAHTRQANLETLTITGSDGVYRAAGKVTDANAVELFSKKGRAAGQLEGAWFPDGMRGAMGELLCAIEEDREPENSARHNLRSLALCFAGLQSTRTGLPHKPGEIRTAGPGCTPQD